MLEGRRLGYAGAIREAVAQLLRDDARVFLIGQGVWSPWYAGRSLDGLDREFGRARVMDSPVSENAITGAAVGAALAGMRPIVFHARMDFALLAADPIVNQAANWSYMFGGRAGVPIVIRTVINRGGEQAAQHSQALHSMFLPVPGLKVVMPSTPYDAKGLLMGAVHDGNPVLYIDDRWLYAEEGEVPEAAYSVPLGRAAVRRRGTDVTVVAVSYMAAQSATAVARLAERGIDAELLDLRSVKPWDREAVFASVARTGRLVVVDGAWRTGGLAAEVVAAVASEIFDCLRAPVERVCLPDAPAPMARALERAYYLDAGDVMAAVEKVLNAKARP